MHPYMSNPLVENVGYPLRRIRLTIASTMTAPSNVTSLVGMVIARAAAVIMAYLASSLKKFQTT